MENTKEEQPEEIKSFELSNEDEENVNDENISEFIKLYARKNGRLRSRPFSEYKIL